MAVNRAFFGLVGITLEGERLEERARELAARAAGRARRTRFAETLHPGGDRRAILNDYKRLCASAAFWRTFCAGREALRPKYLKQPLFPKGASFSQVSPCKSPAGVL